MRIETDICIQGAGPAGAMCALFLAKKNIPCVLIDKAVFPRDKICGDALSGKVVEILNRYDPALIGRLDAEPISLDCRGVSFIAPSLEGLHIPFRSESKSGDKPPGYIAKRTDFDNFLVEEVKKHPSIQFLEGTAVHAFERSQRGFLLQDKEGDISIDTKLVIDAGGAHSRFARKAGGMEMEPKHHCAGIRAYYKNVGGIREGNYIELHFIRDFLPGYFWIFPLPGGYCNVGIGMRSDFVSRKKLNLKTKLPEIIEKYPSLRERFRDAELVDPPRGYGLPLGSRKRPLSGDHYMLCGDAASLIDPFTGEGIGNAVLSGMCAAEQVEAALAKGDFSAVALRGYDEALYRRLWPELRLSYRMQQLVRYPWLFNFVVRKANRNKTLRETITVMFGDIDIREKLRRPGFYFELLFSG